MAFIIYYATMRISPMHLPIRENDIKIRKWTSLYPSLILGSPCLQTPLWNLYFPTHVVAVLAHDDYAPWYFDSISS
jgi:hypothetical protein